MQTPAEMQIAFQWVFGDLVHKSSFTKFISSFVSFSLIAILCNASMRPAPHMPAVHMQSRILDYPGYPQPLRIRNP